MGILLGVAIALGGLLVIRIWPLAVRGAVAAVFGRWARVRFGWRLGPHLGFIRERLADIDLAEAFPRDAPAPELLGESLPGSPYDSALTVELRRANMWAAALGQEWRQRPVGGGPIPFLTTCGFVAFEQGVRLAVIQYFRLRDAFRIRSPKPIDLNGHSFHVIVRPWLPSPQQGNGRAGAGTCWIEFPFAIRGRGRGILTAGRAVLPKGATTDAEVTLRVVRQEPRGRLKFASPRMDAAVIEVDPSQWGGTEQVDPSPVVGYKPVRLLAGSRSVEADVIEHSGFVGAMIPGRLGDEPLTPVLLILNNHLSRGDSGCVGVDLEFEIHQHAPVTPPYLLYQGVYGGKSSVNGYGLMLEQTRIVWGLHFYR